MLTNTILLCYYAQFYRSAMSITTGRTDTDKYNGSHYVFTINNPAQLPWVVENHITDAEFGKAFFEHIDVGVKYIMYCLEEGEQHTAHYQGYVQLVNKKKYQAMRNKFRGYGWVTTRKHKTKHSPMPNSVMLIVVFVVFVYR